VKKPVAGSRLSGLGIALGGPEAIPGRCFVGVPPGLTFAAAHGGADSVKSFLFPRRGAV